MPIVFECVWEKVSQTSRLLQLLGYIGLSPHATMVREGW
jgi:hypothetical protein